MGSCYIGDAVANAGTQREESAESEQRDKGDGAEERGKTESEALLEAKLGSLPAKPGCYLFIDKAGAVVYVGKAKSL
ncbi:MAG TPA: hypothetical protein VLS89_07375, partial [Candidatus Nanopelagicales bacterium]|nr:hypothetical protein [Candidatus Nanopelagicales bacterium]